jgi:excinuclease ABC subunit A
MQVAAASDWIIDLGPGAGEEGGRITVTGPPAEVVKSQNSRTAPYLRRAIDGSDFRES